MERHHEVNGSGSNNNLSLLHPQLQPTLPYLYVKTFQFIAQQLHQRVINQLVEELDHN